MNVSQTILTSLVDNGVCFWDADLDDQTIMISDSLRYMLGFDSNKITFQQIVLRMPEDFRPVVEDKIRKCSEWSFPITASHGIVWLNAHKLQKTSDLNGHMHYIGTARQMTDDEVGERMVATGVDVSTMGPMMKALHQMSNNKSFLEGVHNLLTTIRSQMVGVRAGLMRWDGGDKVTIVDYVGGILINHNGMAMTKMSVMMSPWTRKSMQDGVTLVVDKRTPLSDAWPAEQKFYMRNGIVSVLIVPIVLEDGKVWGSLGVMSPTRQVWSAFDRQWMEMMAHWVAICIDRVALVEKINDQLYLTNEACYAGNLTTWSWDSLTDQRVSNVYRGRSMMSTESNMGETISRKIHGADVARFNRALESIAIGETDSMNLKMRIRSEETGRMEWHEVIGRAAGRVMDGMPVRVVGVSRSIEEELKEEAKEKQKRDFQNSIYNKMPAAIEFFNEDGVLENLNETAMEMFGMASKKSVMGLNIFENPNLTEEQMDMIRDNDEVSLALKYDFGKVVFDTSRTGTFEAIYKMSKLYTKGEFTGYMVVVTDNSNIIRQAKQIDLFQRYFLEVGRFAKMGICWFTDTKNGYVSGQWNKNFGIKADAPYMRNLSLLTKVVDEDLEMYGSLLSRIFVGDIESFQHELRVTHPDGMLHYIRVQFVRSAEAVTGISIDITQTKENEKMLITARHKAEKADMLKSQFLANMSHEIRTPLNAIVGFSDLIANSVESTEAQLYSEIVHENNEILLDIIGAIMDLSKIESGTMEMSFATADVNAVARTVYEKYNNKQHSKVDFVLEVEDGELQSYCDSYHIGQIIGHFISNAFKFTASGKVELSVKRKENDIKIRVSDTGCGISQNQTDKIFDPYVKLDVFSVGTGLGLSISRGLAKEMGGKIDVYSEEGEGAAFELSIPYIGPQDAEKHKKQEASNEIMLLCNNGEMIQFVSYALDGKDIVMEQEHVFMSLWLEKKPKLTIVDQQLFGDSTAVVVASLRSYGPDYKVIVLYPTGPDVDLVSIEAAGAAATIAVPMTSEKLREAVDEVLKTKAKKKK